MTAGLPPEPAPLGAFWFLTWRTARNRLLRQLRRLRKPRYLAASLAGAAYLWYFVFRPRDGATLAGVIGVQGSLELASLLVVLTVAYGWLFGAPTAIGFGAVEVQFLFPAPVRRRELVRYKLVRAQIFLLVNTIIWTALLRRPSSAGYGAVAVAGAPGVALRVVSLWVLFSTLYFHRLGRTLVRASAAEHGLAGLRRQWPVLLIVGGAVLVLVHALASNAEILRAALGVGLLVHALGDVLSAPAPAVVLAPFRLLLAPLYAQGAGEWARAMVPAAALMLLHLLWVLRLDTAFEEAALEESARRAARAERHRAKRLGETAPSARAARLRLPLAPTGAPAVAIVWKNVLAALRAVRRGTFALVALLLLAAWVTGIASDAGAGGDTWPWLVGVVAGIVACVLAAVGPLYARNDLRRDLAQIELLRTFPLGGGAVVAAEVAGAAAPLALTQVALALVSWGALSVAPAPPLDAPDRLALLAAAVVVLPLVGTLGLVVQNGSALLFPAWVRLGPDRPGGIEALGQNVLTIGASLVMVSALLAVPAALAAALAGALWPSLGWRSLPPAALLLALLAALELWPVVRWLGRVYERTDPSSLGR